MDAQGATVKDLETKATRTAERTTHFDKEIKRLSTLVKSLEDKCDSLEGHSRRNNLRIIGLPEGQEGQERQRDFVSELLKDMMDLDSKPLLDQVHRAPQNRPKSNEPSRPITVRCHYHRDCVAILQRASEEDRLTRRGQRLHVFPDYTSAVSKNHSRSCGAGTKLCNGGVQIRRVTRGAGTYGKYGVKESFFIPDPAQIGNALLQLHDLLGFVDTAVTVIWRGTPTLFNNVM
ncbi:hypothetical protein ABVT39_017984 [Epinephelus coioides]